jgi:hypothetical protein
MIFCTDKCPICGTELSPDTASIKEKWITKGYHCPKKRELVRNAFDTNVTSVSHYVHSLLNGGFVFMVIPPFELEHSKYFQTTRTYIVHPFKPKKLLFETPILDADWSQPHNVVRRLKVLVTLS